MYSFISMCIDTYIHIYIHIHASTHNTSTWIGLFIQIMVVHLGICLFHVHMRGMFMYVCASYLESQWPIIMGNCQRTLGYVGAEWQVAFGYLAFQVHTFGEHELEVSRAARAASAEPEPRQHQDPIQGPSTQDLQVLRWWEL